MQAGPSRRVPGLKGGWSTWLATSSTAPTSRPLPLPGGTRLSHTKCACVADVKHLEPRLKAHALARWWPYFTYKALCATATTGSSAASSLVPQGACPCQVAACFLLGRGSVHSCLLAKDTSDYPCCPLELHGRLVFLCPVLRACWGACCIIFMPCTAISSAYFCMGSNFPNVTSGSRYLGLTTSVSASQTCFLQSGISSYYVCRHYRGAIEQIAEEMGANQDTISGSRIVDILRAQLPMRPDAAGASDFHFSVPREVCCLPLQGWGLPDGIREGRLQSQEQTLRDAAASALLEFGCLVVRGLCASPHCQPRDANTGLSGPSDTTASSCAPGLLLHLQKPPARQ